MSHSFDVPLSDNQPIPPAEQSTFTVTIARTPQELERAFRLRYEVYVSEQGKHYASAEHNKRLLVDALDPESMILIALADGRVRGTLRSHRLSIPTACQAFEHMLNAEQFATVPLDERVVCSRLAIDPQYRHTNLQRALFEAYYRIEVIRGTKLCFATCAPRLWPLFRRYGFRRYGNGFVDTTVGLLDRIVLALDDLAGFARCGSPLLSIATELAIRPTPQNWFDTLVQAQERSKLGDV